MFFARLESAGKCRTVSVLDCHVLRNVGECRYVCVELLVFKNALFYAMLESAGMFRTIGVLDCQVQRKVGECSYV
jgi:hypothetical protein